MTHRPPPLATAVLTWCCPARTALAGDLIEEYQARRSRNWYWRQVFVAIVVCTAQDLRKHKVIAVRAVLSAWVFSWLFFEYAYRIFHLDEYLFVTGLFPWFWLNGYHLPDAIQSWWVAVASGWTLSGWLVGRLHRPHGASVILLCVACGIASRGGQLAWWMLSGGDADAVVLAGVVTTQLALCGGTFLLGGLVGAGRTVGGLRRSERQS